MQKEQLFKKQVVEVYSSRSQKVINPQSAKFFKTYNNKGYRDMGNAALLWTFRDSFVSTCTNLWEWLWSPKDRDKLVGCCDLHWLHSEISFMLCSKAGLKLSY